MAKSFTQLEKNILKAKGVSAAQMTKLNKVGIKSRADFATVGDSKTLIELTSLSADVANAVLEWALGARIVVESGDVVYCVHCQKKQPKDYKAGDLCTGCGKQAEAVLACYWCGAVGPGKFCRSCAAELVPTGEVELAIVLKRDGVSKDDIPKKLRGMSASEKDALWARVRRPR